jgi:hypothetical protein
MIELPIKPDQLSSGAIVATAILYKVLLRKDDFFFDTVKMDWRCKQMRLALETGEVHADLALIDTKDEAAIRDDIATLEEDIRADEMVEVDVRYVQDNRPAFRSTSDRNLATTTEAQRKTKGQI